MNKTETIQSLYESLKPVQKEMFRAFLSNNQRKTVIHSSRRLGKTYLLCVLSLCFALNKANSQIRYASTTQKSVRKMIQPIFKEIFSNMPEKYKGKWNSQEGAYCFFNGSQIHVAGVNNGNADSLRGTAADLFVVDEASFVDELTYLIDSVAMPQLLTVPDSKLIMASSSPLSPAHEFVGFIEQAQVNNSYYSYTIHQGGYSPELVEEFCKEAGGENSTTWRREYLNELITDETMSIFPEWDDSYIQDVKPDEYYQYYHRYESLDIGVRDKTLWLSGYYDWKQGKLIIEDEFDISGVDTTTKAIARLIREHRKVEPYRAIADNNNLLLLNDLSSDFDIHFSPTSKDTLPVMINEVRLMLQDGRIIINPRCKQLIGCLKYGVYQDHKRNMFGRSQAYGHYDAAAALTYMVRNLDTQTNPIPLNHGVKPGDLWIPPDYEQVEKHQSLKKLFNL